MTALTDVETGMCRRVGRSLAQPLLITLRIMAPRRLGLRARHLPAYLLRVMTSAIRIARRGVWLDEARFELVTVDES
jgi:hypothetical protein